VTEPAGEHESPIEHEIQKVAEGRAWYTPFEAIGGVGVVITIIVGLVLVLAFLVYYLAG
jgi:hypothetical protein